MGYLNLKLINIKLFKPFIIFLHLKRLRRKNIKNIISHIFCHYSYDSVITHMNEENLF